MASGNIIDENIKRLYYVLWIFETRIAITIIWQTNISIMIYSITFMASSVSLVSQETQDWMLRLYENKANILQSTVYIYTILHNQQFF